MKMRDVRIVSKDRDLIRQIDQALKNGSDLAIEGVTEDGRSATLTMEAGVVDFELS